LRNPRPVSLAAPAANGHDPVAPPMSVVIRLGRGKANRIYFCRRRPDLT
jgi:hypothetical protein